MTIEVTDQECKIYDQYSSLIFKNPNLEFIDNKFMSEDELTAIFTLDDESLILSTEIPSTISERINTIKQGFNVETIQVNMIGEEAIISAKTQAKDQEAKLMDGIVTEMTLNCSTDLLIVPFIIDHDNDMTFKMYTIQDGESNDKSVNKFDTTIGDVNIVVYSRSSLVDNE